MPVETLGRLEGVDVRSCWVDEAREFTPWLATIDNLALLATALDMDLELQGIEVPVGPYKADIVARDLTTDVKVIIESQLEKTNHDHLGKTITYASGLGARVIIWIAREFSEEHRRALDYLNELAAPDFRCYGVEIQLWRIAGSPPAPMFRVIAKPNDYTSAVKEEAKDITETKGVYLEFWSKFKEWAQSQSTFLSLRKPRPQYWYSIAVGRSRFRVTLSASIQKSRLGCELYMRGSSAKQAFTLLYREKMQIEAGTGPLDWQELPEGQDSRVIRYRHNVSIADRGAWPDAFQWLKSEAELFHRTFSPRIRALHIEDEPEQSDED